MALLTMFNYIRSFLLIYVVFIDKRLSVFALPNVRTSLVPLYFKATNLAGNPDLIDPPQAGLNDQTMLLNSRQI